MNEDISVAAAILTAEFIRKEGLHEGDAYKLWRRLRTRMKAEITRDGPVREASPEDADEPLELAGGAV